MTEYEIWKARNFGSQVWHGEGWYTFEQWSIEGGRFAWDENETEAVWVESDIDFFELCEVPEGFEPVVTFYGSGDLPDAPVRVAEKFVMGFTPEQAEAYAERMDQ